MSGQTATFNQNDSILNATTITTYDRPTHTGKELHLCQSISNIIF